MPWTTSALVARIVIGVSAGTTMHAGVKEYCWPIARTVTLPLASSTLPRLLSTNSPERCSRVGIGGLDARLRHGRAMDAGEGRQQRHDDDDDHGDGRPAPLDAGRDLGAAAVRPARSLQRPARQEDEEIEGEPHRDDAGRGDAGEHDRATRPAGHDPSTPVVRGGVGLLGNPN